MIQNPHEIVPVPSTDEIPPEQKELVDQLSREIVRRHLAIPALVVLELSLPLNGLSTHVVEFLTPILGTLEVNSMNPESVAVPSPLQILVRFLERPDSLAYFSDRIEAWEKLRVEEHGSNLSM